MTVARAFFVTGSDTGVGKTLIATALLRAAARGGLRTIGMKPVAAGLDGERAGAAYNRDALALRDAATIDLDYATVNPVLLRRAMAPHVAAAIEGIELRVAELARHCRGVLRTDADLVIAEGAGGWLVPLNDTETMADLVSELGLPVILVVGMRLGCLNHALLTAAAIRARGLALAGWVANCMTVDMPALDENIDSLRARLGAPLLGCVPRVADADAAAACLDLRVLLDA